MNQRMYCLKIQAVNYNVIKKSAVLAAYHSAEKKCMYPYKTCKPFGLANDDSIIIFKKSLKKIHLIMLHSKWPLQLASNNL